jgi:hypothetical protein
MTNDDLTTWRLDHERRLSGIENAVQTLADAAEQQERFNERVVEFMAAMKAWGVIALLLYGTGQALMIARLS